MLCGTWLAVIAQRFSRREQVGGDTCCLSGDNLQIIAVVGWSCPRLAGTHLKSLTAAHWSGRLSYPINVGYSDGDNPNFYLHNYI